MKPSNHKTCISFPLKCPKDFNFAQPFCPFSPVSYQNCQVKLKSYGSSREKLKHLLWLEDLKASLINSTKNVFINPYLPLMEYIQNMTNSKVFCESKIMVMDLSAKILIEMLTKSSLLSRLASSCMILYLLNPH